MFQHFWATGLQQYVIQTIFRKIAITGNDIVNHLKQVYSYQRQTDRQDKTHKRIAF